MIESGKVVNLAYTLTNAAGEVLDKADVNDPFNYMQGAGQIVPGLESAMAGCKVGDKKVVSVTAEEGYGEVDPSLKLTVKKAQFPEGVDVQPGMQFEANGPGGQGLVFTVESIDGEEVHIDGNHPLAGVALNFDVEVLEVRDATAEEKEHGHSHDGDGHHHH